MSTARLRNHHKMSVPTPRRDTPIPQYTPGYIYSTPTRKLVPEISIPGKVPLVRDTCTLPQKGPGTIDT